MGRDSIRRYAGRTVRIHVPPGYEPARQERYPLLLLHDGQNLFGAEPLRPDVDAASAPPPRPWLADQTVDRLVGAKRIEPVVVAGIDHAGEDRVREFTPTPGNIAGAGRAREYAELVIFDLVPALANDFPVRVDVDGLGLGGSSMGGLITLWMALMFPARFGRLMVMSPSLWWDRRALLRRCRRQAFRPVPRIWLDAGRREGRSVTRDGRQLFEVLRRQDPRRVRYVEDPMGDHSEASWGRRFEGAVEWLYRG